MKLECQELLNNMLINDWRGIKENLIMKKNNENLSAMSDIRDKFLILRLTFLMGKYIKKIYNNAHKFTNNKYMSLTMITTGVRLITTSFIIRRQRFLKFPL
jgi:hypothetical protein